ncbi:hypothetical protein MPSEU_000171500 [Mayamaea pseudoterrestris]|nr:hypothetical protein MPSEU_000171500 [Mayamaea pseudoterrestris]
MLPLPYPLPSIGDPQTQRYVLGLFFIIVQCVTWVLAGVLTQYLYSTKGFHSPFLMSYIGMSMLAFLLPIKALTDRVGLTNFVPVSIKSFDSLEREISQLQNYTDIVDLASRRTEELIQNQDTQWNHRRHIVAAMYIAPAMFCADWACNAAMVHTTLASVTVLISTQSVLVFAMAVMLRLEKYDHCKLIGVMMAVIGTAMTTFEDAETDMEADGTGRALFGDVMAFLASVAFATYSIQIRLFCPQNEDLYSTQLLLGYAGILCSIPLFPFALWIAYEQITLTATVFALVVIKGIMDFMVIEYLFCRIIVSCGATTATVGIGLTIPMALFADWMLGEGVDSLISLWGAVAVIVGFLVVNLTANSSSEPDPTFVNDEKQTDII